MCAAEFGLWLRDLREGLKQAAKADQQQQRQQQQQSPNFRLRCSQEENMLRTSSSIPRDQLPSITLSVSPRQSLQTGRCKMDTAKKFVSAGWPAQPVDSACASSNSEAAGLQAAAVEDCTAACDEVRSIETELHDLVDTSDRLGQRDWRMQGFRCRASTSRVQGTVNTLQSQLPLLQPQAGEVLIL